MCANDHDVIRSPRVHHARPRPADDPCARRGLRPVDGARRHDLALPARASERLRRCARRLACTAATVLSIYPWRVVVAQHDPRARRSGGRVRDGDPKARLVDPRGGLAVPQESVDADGRVGAGHGGRFGAARTRGTWVVVEAVPRGLFRAERARDGSVLTWTDDVTRCIIHVWTIQVARTLG